MLDAQQILIYGASSTGLSFMRMCDYLHKKYVVCDDDELVLRRCRDELGCPVISVDQVRAADFDLILTSPGIRPTTKIFHSGLPVWGDWELAWHINNAEVIGPRKIVFAITGSNGKTTTTMMTYSIIAAAGKNCVQCGNLGPPVLDAMLDNPDAEILIGELSSFQLHYAPSFIPDAGVLINVDPDHIDWHGSMTGYLAAKKQILRGKIAIISKDDPIAGTLRGAQRTIGITLGPPELDEIGISPDGQIVDWSFCLDSKPIILIPARIIKPPTPAGHIDALAAIALARSIGIRAESMQQALSSFETAPHRGQVVSVCGDITYIDNSKATNPHAAMSAFADVKAMYPASKIIWLAGGQLKGAEISPLIRKISSQLAAVITFGVDSEVIVEAFSQHATDVPIFWLISEDDSNQLPPEELPTCCEHGASSSYVPQISTIKVSGAANGERFMYQAVDIAQEIARPGDVILLAPAAASLDMFSGYSQRGEAFIQAALSKNSH